MNIIPATKISSFFLGSNCPTMQIGTARSIKIPAQIKKGAELVMTSGKEQLQLLDRNSHCVSTPP